MTYYDDPILAAAHATTRRILAKLPSTTHPRWGERSEHEADLAARDADDTWIGSDEAAARQARADDYVEGVRYA